MEVAMVSAFSGAMGSLLSKLAGLLEKDFKLARGVKDDIVSLRDEMSTINASLMELSQMEEPIDDVHRELRAKVRELAYDMEDCLDISMHRLGDASKAGFLSELKTFRARCKIAKLISDLKARVAQLGNRHKLTLQLPERPRAVRVDPLIQALYQDAASLQGIGGHREKIVELLQDGAPQLKVVSILGAGGIGKTTLANQVYTAIQDKFDCTAFVSVSRIPDLLKLLSDIIRKIRWSSTSVNDVEGLINDIRERLENKRYLIVIDDMWKIEAWNTIKCCFVENNRGSRFITTTRIEDTAKSCCSGFHDYVYKMEPLNDVDSRILFHRRIFHSEDACPEHLKSISSEILKKCGGLPLAILTIGSILASDREVIGLTKTWEKMLHSFRFQMESSQNFEWLRHVFNLGYNDLSLELKTCLLYLGIFPEDYKIAKDDLLRRWIAEGFVTEKYNDIQEEIAESYFNELTNRNMLQIAELDDCGEVFSCRVHDLLLDYIIIKCREENFVTIVNDQQSTKGPLDVRRLSLHVKHSERNDILENMALTKARSFNFWGPAQWLPSLTKFRLLRVLNLDINGSMDRRYDMSCIHNLFQLRYLRTNGIPSNEILLTQLRKLEQLRTVEVASEYRCFGLDAQMLPPMLRHLIVPAVVYLDGGIGHLRNLHTLSEYAIQDVERMKELGKLTNLRELKLFRRSFGAGEALLSSLCKLANLRSIVIRRSLDDGEDVLARWSPPPGHLRRLHVLELECLFSTIPADWITQLHNLSSLEILVRSLPSNGIVILAKLTMLVHLKLHVQERVPGEGFVVFHRAAFPDLRELLFRWEAPCLVFEEGTMPRLRSLVIDCYAQGQRQADGVLDGIQHLGSLVEFKVHVYQREGYIKVHVYQLEGYIPMGFICADVNRPQVEEQRRWDGTSLKAALKEAISKHPGSLRVVIETV